MKYMARIAVLYAVFAALATAANLGAQGVVIWVYTGPRAIEASILIGTLSGLPIKYFLEKRFIFDFRAKSISHDGRTFFVYSYMGTFTTAIFWGVEYAFHLIFGTDAMRYLGGALGLMIGYTIKYQLDKRYVFVTRAGSAIGVV